jgi:hypothetical protein
MLISFCQCKQQTADNMVYYYNTGEQYIFKAGRKPIGPHARVIYSRLFKYKQQHNAASPKAFHKIMMDIVH